jgi:hypothetical protein
MKTREKGIVNIPISIRQCRGFGWGFASFIEDISFLVTFVKDMGLTESRLESRIDHQNY